MAVGESNLQTFTKGLGDEIVPAFKALARRIQFLETSLSKGTPRLGLQNTLGTGSSSTAGQPADVAALVALEKRLSAEISNVAAWIDAEAYCVWGPWFWTQEDCVTFAWTHVPEGAFQWFVDLITYI